jgi:hypothetical protein
MNQIISFSTNTLPYRLNAHFQYDDYQMQCLTVITLTSLVLLFYLMSRMIISLSYAIEYYVFSHQKEDESEEDNQEEREDERDGEDEEGDEDESDNGEHVPEGFVCSDCEQLTCPHCRFPHRTDLSSLPRFFKI